MMTPAEMVQFFSERSAKVARALLAAQAAGNFPLAEQNARQLLKNRLMVGLLTWRLGGEARSAMEDVVAAFAAARAALRQMDSRANVDQALPVPNALLIAFLVDKDLEYSPRATERSEHDAYERHLDWLLVSAMRGTVDSAKVDEAVAELAGRKRCRLAADTYRTYFDILWNAEQRRQLADLVRAAEDHYSERARDPFYSSGQTDGGGPDSDHVIDYRLGAILKKVGYQGDSIHRWRW